MNTYFEKPIEEPSVDVLADLHYRMVRIRLFEETSGQLFEQAKMPGFIHLYVGQEAVAAGFCVAMDEGDQVSSTHRGHGHLVAKGGDLKQMMAELMGKATGYCNGKGGSMHICDLDLNMLGANGIVGAGIPIAVGAGFANLYQKTGNVSVVFFGDGATNIGAFHEAVNMAATLKLPVVFVCENNQYSEFTPRDKTMAIDEVVERAAAYGIPGTVVDGMNAVAVWDTAKKALKWTREGNGPSFVECKTYRYYNHHGVQTLGVKYRSDEEVEEWRALDPIDHLEAKLLSENLMTEDEINKVRENIANEVETAVSFAESSPYPNPDELLNHVYSESTATS